MTVGDAIRGHCEHVDEISSEGDGMMDVVFAEDAQMTGMVELTEVLPVSVHPVNAEERDDGRVCVTCMVLDSVEYADKGP